MEPETGAAGTGDHNMSRLIITLAIDNASSGKAIGVKESIAMDLEKYGDVKVLRVEVQKMEQIRLEEK